MSRRRIPPTSRPTPSTFQPSNSPLNNEFNEPIVPKHIAFVQSSITQGENEILSELIIFVFTLIAASAQFVHLYRSVWWHPESYHNYSMVSKGFKFIDLDSLEIYSSFLEHFSVPLLLFIFKS